MSDSAAAAKPWPRIKATLLLPGVPPGRYPIEMSPVVHGVSPQSSSAFRALLGSPPHDERCSVRVPSVTQHSYSMATISTRRFTDVSTLFQTQHLMSF